MHGKKTRCLYSTGGGFQTLPNNATVSMQLDNSTAYVTYMSVLDQIMQGLNSLRDSLCKDKFGVSFERLNDKVESDKQKISAIRQVYPKKIMKEKIDEFNRVIMSKFSR